MDVLGQFRDDQVEQRRATAAQRARAAESWMAAGGDPAMRLLRFDTWVRAKLETTLDWSWAGENKTRVIEQCRLELERLVGQLWERGWMLDGRRLARHVETALADMATAQAKGRVREFWPYFAAVVRRYVGLNAEEIQAEAMSAGAHVGQALQALLRANPGPSARPPSITELIHQRRAELAARRRAEATAEKPGDDQLRLW